MISSASEGSWSRAAPTSASRYAADGGRLVGVGVAGAQPAAEVVDRELAERSDRRDRPGERLDVEDLRSHVDVHALHAQARAALDPADQLGGGRRRQAELRAGVAGQHVRVRVGDDAGDDAHQHILRAACGHGRLEPVDVVGVVDHDEADPVLDGHLDLLVGLGVAVKDEQRGVGAGLARGHDLAPTRHVESEALLDHHPLHRRARERLGREDHARARPARGELALVLARAVAERRLGDDQHRRPELEREIVGAAASDGEHPVTRERAPGREQRQHVHAKEPRSRCVTAVAPGDKDP